MFHIHIDVASLIMNYIEFILKKFVSNDRSVESFSQEKNKYLGKKFYTKVSIHKHSCKTFVNLVSTIAKPWKKSRIDQFLFETSPIQGVPSKNEIKGLFSKILIVGT